MGPESSNYLSYHFRKTVLSWEVLLVAMLTFISASVVSGSLIDIGRYLGLTVLVWGIPISIYLKVSEIRGPETKGPKFIDRLSAILWFITTLLITGGIYKLNEYLTTDLFTGVYILLLLGPIAYSARLLSLTALYRNTEMLFYYSDDSVAGDEWYDASVHLSKATEFVESTDRLNLRGLVYSRLAVGRYQDVIDIAEEHNQQQEIVGATLLARAAYELYWAYISQIYSVKKKQEHIDNFLYLTHEAHTELSLRVCSMCSNKKDIEDTYQIIRDDGSMYYLCASCYESAKYTDQNTSQSNRYTKDYSTNSEYTHSSQTSSTGSRSQSTTETYTQLSQNQVDAFCSILEISKPLTESKIDSAYRDKVKNVHPDMENGSVEKFKEVSEAKTKLLKHIDKT